MAERDVYAVLAELRAAGLISQDEMNQVLYRLDELAPGVTVEPVEVLGMVVAELNVPPSAVSRALANTPYALHWTEIPDIEDIADFVSPQNMLEAAEQRIGEFFSNDETEERSSAVGGFLGAMGITTSESPGKQGLGRTLEERGSAPDSDRLQLVADSLSAHISDLAARGKLSGKTAKELLAELANGEVDVVMTPTGAEAVREVTADNIAKVTDELNKLYASKFFTFDSQQEAIDAGLLLNEASQVLSAEGEEGDPSRPSGPGVMPWALNALRTTLAAAAQYDPQTYANMMNSMGAGAFDAYLAESLGVDATAVDVATYQAVEAAKPTAFSFMGMETHLWDPATGVTFPNFVLGMLEQDEEQTEQYLASNPPRPGVEIVNPNLEGMIPVGDLTVPTAIPTSPDHRPMYDWRAGDQVWYWREMSPERRSAFVRAATQYGIIDPEQAQGTDLTNPFSLAGQQLLSQALGVSRDLQIDPLAAMHELGRYQRFTDAEQQAQTRAPFSVPASLRTIPDYPTLQQRVTELVRDELGRDPKDWEVVLLADELQRQHRNQNDAMIAAARDAYDGKTVGGYVEVPDPATRTQRFFDETYANELNRLQDIGEAQVSNRLIVEAIARGSNMVTNL